MDPKIVGNWLIDFEGGCAYRPLQAGGIMRVDRHGEAEILGRLPLDLVDRLRNSGLIRRPKRERRQFKQGAGVVDYRTL